MAMVSYKDRVALCALETTYGTAPTLAAANAVLLMNSSVAPAADELAREVDRPYFGGDPFVLVGKRIELTADIDLLGAKTPGVKAPLGALYQICGHNEVLEATTSATYNPISRGFSSGAIDFFWGGIRFRMLGVRGTLNMEFNIKTYAKASITLTGLLVLPVDGDAPAGIDWDAFQTPAAIETETWTVTVGSVDVCANSLTLNQNGTVQLVECSSGREVMITDRKTDGVLRVHKDATLAQWNPFALAEAQEIVVLTNKIERSAGLNVSVPIRAQLKYPQMTDIDGTLGYEIGFTAVPSGAGGDEYSMIFT